MIDYKDNNNDDSHYNSDRIISPVADLDDAVRDIEEKIRPQTLTMLVSQLYVSKWKFLSQRRELVEKH